DVLPGRAAGGGGVDRVVGRVGEVGGQAGDPAADRVGAAPVRVGGRVAAEDGPGADLRPRRRARREGAAGQVQRDREVGVDVVAVLRPVGRGGVPGGGGLVETVVTEERVVPVQGRRE